MIIKVAGLVSTFALLAAISTGAMAQTANSTSGAQSGSNASSGSSSGAVSSSRGGNSTGNSQGLTSNTNLNAGVTIDQRNQSTGAGQQGVNYTGGTNSYETSRQTGDVTIRTTPQVYAPPVSGGNPCTLAVSGGVSVIGWGAAAGGTFVDEACATRQKIAMIHNAGYAGAAKELMCDDRATYMAFRTAGQPCAFRQAFEAPGAPVAQPVAAPQPVPVGPPTPPASRVSTVAPKQYLRCNPRAGIVDNCVSG